MGAVCRQRNDPLVLLLLVPHECGVGRRVKVAQLVSGGAVRNAEGLHQCLVPVRRAQRISE